MIAEELFENNLIEQVALRMWKTMEEEDIQHIVKKKEFECGCEKPNCEHIKAVKLYVADEEKKLKEEYNL